MSESPSHVAAASTDSAQSARWHLPSHLRLWLVAIAGLAADLWTKHWAFTRLDPEPIQGMVIIPRLMTFHRSLNSGALFGLGKGFTIVFIIASILALAFVLFLFVHSTRDRWSLHVALGLVLAGALGNLYDRTFSIADVVKYTVNGRQRTEIGKIVSENEHVIALGSWPEKAKPRLIRKDLNPTVRQMGVVRDFIRMEPRIKLGSREFDIWPWVFNIADTLLVLGVGLLMLNFWRERKHEAPPLPVPADANANT